MRALHIFPTYAPDVAGGSDAYQRGLTRALAHGGVEVEVHTTRSRRPLPRATFGIDWPADFPGGREDDHGVPVYRFSASFSPGPVLGRLLSLPIVERWRREEARSRMTASSEEAVESYRRRALARPLLFDRLALAGRGPHSAALVRAGLRAARRCDVVLAGFTPFATMWYAALVARHAGKPLVLLPFFHPEDPYHHFRVHYRLFARADALLAETAHAAALFERIAPGCKPIEVGAGIDAGELADGGIDGGRFRRRHGLDDARIVLFVGRKERSKRYDLAVEAVDRIADERVHLVMIGEEVDGRPIASARVHNLGVLPRADLLDAYDACEVFVLPSEHESFGIVFLEAWMRRKPVIGNARCGPVSSLIDAGTDGLLASDAGQLADAIKSLFSDPEGARRMGETGHAKVLARYTWTHVASRVRSLYEDLAGRRSGGAGRFVVAQAPYPR